jgi:hypothetical protein
MGFGLTRLEGICLKREGFIWKGWYLREGRGPNFPFVKREVRPASNWTVFWDKVQGLGILTLPDLSLSLQEQAQFFDGESYVVEIRDAEHYRTFAYSNPALRTGPEAKRMVEIVATLRRELVDSALSAQEGRP